MNTIPGLLLCSAMFWSNTAIAQLSKQQAIDETQPGWIKVYHFRGAKESKIVDDRTFSIAQLSISDSLANWMQASYLPKLTSYRLTWKKAAKYFV